jgi:ABC-type Mn2+/Zn2+ transport system permease subunit
MDLSFIALPFFQRAILGGLIVSFLLSFFGVITILRRSSFFGDAVAHASLTGVAIGLLSGFSPLLSAIFYASGVSFLIPYLNKVSKLAIDSLLGIILPVSMSLGVILITASPGYQPELLSFLFGNILSISNTDLIVISITSFIAIFCFFFFLRKIINISFDPDYAVILGIRVRLIDNLYHILLAISIVLGVSIVGVILVNALLIIPASIAKLYSKSLTQMLVLTPILAVSITLFGIFLSILFDIPTGPTIALVGGFAFIVSAIIKR